MERMQVALNYRYSNERIEGEYVVCDALPVATWTCQCSQEVTSANLYNGLFFTHCACGLAYSIDWRHGLEPKVLLIG